MLVREVPFDAWTAVFSIILTYMVVSFVYLMIMWIGEGKEWTKKVDRWFLPCVSYISMIACLIILGTHAMMSNHRPVAEGDYESVGSYAATVTRVYPHAVEVETEYGVSLPVPAPMMPEGASTVGTTVVIDVSKLSSKPRLEVQRPSGDDSSADSSEPIFVENDDCKSSGVLSCAEVFGDAKVGVRFLPGLYYGVTGVRAS